MLFGSSGCTRGGDRCSLGKCAFFPRMAETGEAPLCANGTGSLSSDTSLVRRRPALSLAWTEHCPSSLQFCRVPATTEFSLRAHLYLQFFTAFPCLPLLVMLRACTAPNFSALLTCSPKVSTSSWHPPVTLGNNLPNLGAPCVRSNQRLPCIGTFPNTTNDCAPG